MGLLLEKLNVLVWELSNSLGVCKGNPSFANLAGSVGQTMQSCCLDVSGTGVGPRKEPHLGKRALN